MTAAAVGGEHERSMMTPTPAEPPTPRFGMHASVWADASECALCGATIPPGARGVRVWRSTSDDPDDYDAEQIPLYGWHVPCALELGEALVEVAELELADLEDDDAE